VKAHQIERRHVEITITYPTTPFGGIASHNDGDGHGGFACFICDRSMDRGESFICISRRLEILQDREGSRKVIDAMASLQVCRECTLLSAHHRLNWAHKPKLVELEICGFYTYARLLSDAIVRMKFDTHVAKVTAQSFLADASYFSITPDRTGLLGGQYNANPISIMADEQCYECHDIISFNKPYMMIEVGIDTPRSTGITQSNVLPLGRYCNKCSWKLLPLYDHLW